MLIQIRCINETNFYLTSGSSIVISVEKLEKMKEKLYTSKKLYFYNLKYDINPDLQAECFATTYFEVVYLTVIKCQRLPQIFKLPRTLRLCRKRIFNLSNQ